MRRWSPGPFSRSILFLALLAALLFHPFAEAANVPSATRPLRDDARVLDSSSAAAVRQICNALERDTGAELVILTMRTTSGENHHDFALRVFNQWGVGRTGVDNGMLIFFALDDRRVEIIPGIRYKNRFDQSTCTDLLTTYVVPQMKRGKPGEGVIAAARQVADRVRVYEGKGKAVPAERPANRVGGTTTPQSSSSPGTSAPGPSRWSKFAGQLVSGRTLVLFLLLGWLGVGFTFFVLAFNSGNLLLPRWLMFTLLGLGGVGLIALAFTQLELDRRMADQVLGGVGALGMLGFYFCGSHMCPRCNKYLSIDTRTLRSPTYDSSGLGEQTEHCDSCMYHNVFTYSISRKTRHHHCSSSHSSGGFRSSGGRSSGGGGGASW